MARAEGAGKEGRPARFAVLANMRNRMHRPPRRSQPMRQYGYKGRLGDQHPLLVPAQTTHYHPYDKLRGCLSGRAGGWLDHSFDQRAICNVVCNVCGCDHKIRS